MASITVSMDNSFKERLDNFPWVNWSEVGREELNKRRILEEFLRFRKLSANDEIFCEEHNWHPTDELPTKEAYIKKLQEIQKGKHTKPMNIKDTKRFLDSL